MSQGEFQTTFGIPGATVSPGKYALDWINFLGGTAALDQYGTGLVLTMPLAANGTPVQWPIELQTLIVNHRQSLLAAIVGKVYPPGSDQPPPPGAGILFQDWIANT